MPGTILVYGASGFSGRLIAGEVARRRDASPAHDGKARAAFDTRLLLAGRDGRRLVRLANDLSADTRVFALDDRRAMEAALQDVDVVINAAGPFAFTAEALARAALEAGCDYVDINGEVDVYLRLDDYGWLAEKLGVAMVSGAAYLGGASNLLLGAALAAVRKQVRPVGDLGSVSIGVAAVPAFTRGSAQSAWRTLREQVTVVRKGQRPDQHGHPQTALVLWHEPVGKLEHAFDFTGPAKAFPPVKDAPSGDRLSIATAVNFVDTLAARCTLRNYGVIARSVTSYLEAGAFTRLGYTMAGMLAPVLAAPPVDALARAQFELLPTGLRPFDLDREQQLVLEIEGPLRERCVEWIWITPNAYRLTARIATAVAYRLMDRRDPHCKKLATELIGWCTPHDVLAVDAAALRSGVFDDCELTERHTARVHDHRVGA
jgi:saccharopine dehydrogenase-like protein